MARFIRHQDIDPVLWDRAVRGSSTPTALATFRYLDLLADGRWNAVVEDDYRAVLPLPWRARLGVPYIYTPFFLHRMGVFAPHPTDGAGTRRLFDAIPKKYRQVDLLLNPDNDPSRLPSHPTPLTSHYVDLDRPFAELEAGFAANTRRNIKSSGKHFLTMEYDENILSDIVTLFRNNRGRDRAVSFREADYRRLVRVAESLLREGMLDVVGVREPEGRLAAGALMLRDYDRIVFWFSGRDGRAADSKPMFFLLNEYLRQHCASPLVFDFNGSANPNVARFYRGFGGIPYPIPIVAHSRGAIPKVWKSLRNKSRK